MWVLSRVAAHNFEMLLDRALRIKCDLAERYDVDRSCLRDELTAAVQHDSRLKGRVSAIVEHDSDSIVPDLQQPVIRHIILGNS